MSIHVTRAPTVPLTSYDTKRSSHLKIFFHRVFLMKVQNFISNEMVYYQWDKNYRFMVIIN